MPTIPLDWMAFQPDIKDSASIATVPVAHIINLSMITGVVPGDLKSARVVPLFKKSGKTKTGNYTCRPVSILNIVSKVLVRVFYDKYEGFLFQNKFLFEYQSGFIRGFCFPIKIGKHLIWISTEVRSYMHMHMRTFFQQNPPLVFGRALLLKSKIHFITIDLDREMGFPYSVIKIDMTRHLFALCLY